MQSSYDPSRMANDRFVVTERPAGTGQKRSFEYSYKLSNTSSIKATVCCVTDPWWKSLGRILWWVFSRPWAVMMALGWPLMVAYGLMNPRATDLTALHLASNEVALLVGIGGSADAGTGERSYVVLPRALTTAAVTVINDATPPSVEEINGALLIVLTVWAVCVYLGWRYCWRPASTAWRKLDQRRA